MDPIGPTDLEQRGDDDGRLRRDDLGPASVVWFIYVYACESLALWALRFKWGRRPPTPASSIDSPPPPTKPSSPDPSTIDPCTHLHTYQPINPSIDSPYTYAP